MAMTLAALLALLPDNTTGDIGADDMRTITTELFGHVPVAGTAGQVLTKNSGTDLDVSWQTPTVGGGGLTSVTTTDSSTIDFSGLGTSGSPLTAIIPNGSVTAAKVAADVATQAELDAHTTASSAAHAASAIATTPLLGLSSTNVQAALDELEAEITALPTLTTSDTTKVPINTSGGVTTLDVSKLAVHTNGVFTNMTAQSSALLGVAISVRDFRDTTTNPTTAAGIEMYNNQSHAGRWSAWHKGGAADAPAQTPSGSTLGGVTFRGSPDATTYSAAAAASIIVVADENVTSTNKGSHMDLSITPVGTSAALAASVRLQSDSAAGVSFKGAIRVGSGATMGVPTSGYTVESISAGNGIGYGTGAGAAVTQTGSRTTAVTNNGICGSITMVAGAPTVGTWVTFVVNNTSVRSGDTIRVNCQTCNASNKYIAHAGTIVNATSFELSVTTIVGTTSDSPVFNFSIFRGVNA